jgi:uncharacterized OB-fold protein
MNELLLPDLNELTTPFWEGCRNGELRVQACPDTGRLMHPPRYRSPWSPQHAPHWVTVSGIGRIWSMTEPHPPLIPQFAALVPYNVIVVALEEDPSIRLVGNLLASADAPINSVPFEEIKIGTRVRVVFQKVTDDFYFPRWIPVR